MATSRVQSCDKSKDQAKVLARHTHTKEDYDEEQTALTTRIALLTHLLPPASVLKPGVNHEYHLRRDLRVWTGSMRYCWGPITGD